MKSITFSLDNQEYIQLNNLLKVLHLVGTGGEANILIMEGEVWVNDQQAFEKRKKIRAGDRIKFANHLIIVS